MKNWKASDPYTTDYPTHEEIVKMKRSTLISWLRGRDIKITKGGYMLTADEMRLKLEKHFSLVRN